MHEETTVIAELPKSSPAGARARGAPRDVANHRRVRLAPAKKLTGAHLAIARRPKARAEAAQVMTAVAEHLSLQLGVPVALEAQLSDATLEPLAHLAKRGSFALLELSGDGLAVLELDPIVVGALLRHAAGRPVAAAPLRLTRIEEAALGWLVLSSLSAVQKLDEARARYRPRLVSLHGERGEILERIDSARNHVALLLTARVHEVSGTARLVLPSTWLETALASMPPLPPEPLHPSVTRASLEASCLIGSMMVSQRDVDTLGVGDVLVFPLVTAEGSRLSGPGRLVTSSFELRGSFSSSGFSLTRAFERLPLETTVSTADPTVPVEVEIELTRLRVPLDQLGALQPGAVLPLHINAAQSVVLRVGDRAVARAELVEIEGEIGARVLSML